MALPVYGEVKLDISGQIRWRGEIERKIIHPAVGTRNFSLLRTRIMTRANIKDNAQAVVQFQDSRMFGCHDASGTLNSLDNVDIHQAYIQIEHLWKNGPGFRAGRFEVNLGNQRIFGAVGWHNVGRAWEGLTAWKDLGNINLAGYWLKQNERNNASFNLDFDVFGLTADINQIDIQALAFYEYKADYPSILIDPYTILGSQYRALKRISTGFYGDWQYKTFDIEANAVFQFGRKQEWGTDTAGNKTDQLRDISAFMFTVEVWHTFSSKTKPGLAAGIDYTSGDDKSDDKIETYNNLYYTGHKFRGYMDYFIESDSSGLMDIVLKGKFNPAHGWTCRADFHYFTRTADYIDFNSKKTQDVGVEIDLTAQTGNIAGVNLDLGTSIFFPTESFAGYSNPDPAWWGYIMMTADFSNK